MSRAGILADTPEATRKLGVTTRLELTRHGYRPARDKPLLWYKSLACGEAVFVDFRAVQHDKYDWRPRHLEDTQAKAPRFYSTVRDLEAVARADHEVLSEIAYEYIWLRRSDRLNTACMAGLEMPCVAVQNAPFPPSPPVGQTRTLRCAECGAYKTSTSEFHDHHISYNPEEVVRICNVCHAKVHHSEDPAYDHLRPAPDQARPEPERSYKLVDCPGYKGKCWGGGQMQAPVDEEESTGRCYRCRKKLDRDRQREERNRSGRDRRPAWQRTASTSGVYRRPWEKR